MASLIWSVQRSHKYVILWDALQIMTPLLTYDVTPLCKKNFVKFKLSYRGPHLWNKFIARNNDLLEAVTIKIFKMRLQKIIFASTNVLENF